MSAHRQRRPLHRFALLVPIAALTVAVAGCSDDSAGPGGGSGTTVFVGVLSGSDATSGGLSFTFASAPGSGNVSATGTLKRSGQANVSLTGAANGTAFSATGGGFTLTGTLASGAISGSFTRSGAAGGSFVVLGSTTANATIAFCGTYSGNGSSGPENGTFNLAVGASQIYGTAVDEGGDALQFTGTRSGNNVSVANSNASGSLAVTGTIAGNSVSGTYTTRLPNNTVVTQGTWSGTRCD